MWSCLKCGPETSNSKNLRDQLTGWVIKELNVRDVT